MVGVILISIALWMRSVEGFADDATKVRCRFSQSLMTVYDNYTQYQSCDCKKQGGSSKPENFTPTTKYVMTRCEHACVSNLFAAEFAHKTCPELY